MPGEYELAAERLEILKNIQELEAGQKKLAMLQQQLEKIDLLLQSPVIQQGDRSASALTELKNQLKTITSPFFSSLQSKLATKHPNEIFTETINESAKASEFLMKQGPASGEPLDLLQQRLTSCDKHFSNYTKQIFELAQSAEEDVVKKGKLLALLADFKAIIDEEWTKLISIAPTTFQYIKDSPFDPYAPARLVKLYNQIVNSKKDEISLSEALDSLPRNCEAEKQKLEAAIIVHREKQSEYPQLQEKLKSFDKQYFGDPDVEAIMPREQLWKLGIDAKDHGRGRLGYDVTEPGYMHGMETAIAFVLRSANDPLTPELIGQVRRITCYFEHQFIDRANPTSGFPDMKSEQYYPDSPGNFPISPHRSSHAGISEMVNLGVWDEEILSIYLATDIDRQINISSYISREHRNPVESVEKSINQYHQWMQEAQDDNDKKLLAITKFCRLIDCAHPFKDGNIRTVRLLMLMLMIQNNLSPTMMVDPNVIDGYSSREIAGAIKEGQHIYELEYLLANIDNHDNKDKLKAKIIDHCEERNVVFIANNVRKLCELFPEHAALMKSMAQCAQNKNFYLCYKDPEKQSAHEAYVKTVFDQYHTQPDRTLTSTRGTLFGSAGGNAGTPIASESQANDRPSRKP